MNYYNVIMRIPVQAFDMREAYIEASALEVGLNQDDWGAELVSVEYTGPVEEET